MSSIIYVGSRNMSREDRYYKKDNWGMYRNEAPVDIKKKKKMKPKAKPKSQLKKQVTKKVTNESIEKKDFYQFISKLGRMTDSNKIEDQTKHLIELRKVLGKGILGNKIIRKILCAYNECFLTEKNHIKQDRLIKIYLKEKLYKQNIPLKTIENVLKYEHVIFTNKPTENVQQKVKKQKNGININKSQNFYDNLCQISRKLVSKKKQKDIAERLILEYKIKDISAEEVTSVLNAYLLCCYGSKNQSEKNRRITSYLERYLISSKVRKDLREKIMEIEGI